MTARRWWAWVIVALMCVSGCGQSKSAKVHALVEQGTAALAAGHVGEARRIALRALSEDAGRAEGHLLLGKVDKADHDIYGALSEMEQAVKIDPALLEGHRLLDYWYEEHGDLDRALLHARQAVALAPDDVGIHYDVASLELKTEQYDAALKDFQWVVARDKNHADAHNGLAVALNALGKTEAAVREFKIAADLFRRQAADLGRQAAGLVRRGQFEEGRRLWEQALEADPTYTEAYHYLGEVNRRLGRTAAAVKYYSRYLALNPDGAFAIEDLQHLADLRARSSDLKRGERASPRPPSAQPAEASPLPAVKP